MSFTFFAKASASVSVGGGGGGGGGCSTVTRAVASCVPPGPFAVSRYVIESVGVTCVDPLASTFPVPSNSTSVALVVCHVSVADWPFWIVAGFAVSEAVGAAGGGGGGGGGAGCTFFLQAPNTSRPQRASNRTAHFILFSITSSSNASLPRQ